MPKEKLILKDVLFNHEKIVYLARIIKNVYWEFQSENFIHETFVKFPQLELKQRILHITDMLYKYLPQDYVSAVNILLKSLPAELDSTKSDGDFWDFIFAPYGEFISQYWCEEKYLNFSLQNLEIITKRFSMEFALRDFLKKFPQETLKFAQKWSKNDNYHVRRFSSEAIRPNLPWGWKVDIWVKNTFKILDNLFADQTQYVLRSVANNLNDITKLDANAVISKLLEWKKSEKQSQKNMLFLITHSLRSEIKSWNPKALELLWYYQPAIKINDFRISELQVNIWEYLEFWFELTSNISQKLLINYKIYFVMSNGKLREKIFHISKKNISKWEKITISKKHSLKNMTTKKLYSWKHYVEIFINGENFWKKEFEFKST